MILLAQRLDPIACAGLLVIGDPHVGSRRPGRRKDAAWPDPVLAKLERCVALANARDLVPVILGDLFDRPVEPDVALKAQLVRTLQGFRHRPLVNVGNHDMTHTTLSDGDSLALLGLCDVIDVAPACGPVATLAIGGHRLGIGMTPYGQPIPVDVAASFSGVDRVAWFTHHDIAFETSYPGAVPPHAVAGCDLVVNGHVHRTQKAAMVGRTRWLNPGNITRQSVDLKDHVPRAWILDAAGELDAQALPFEPDVFDLTGRLVDAADDAAVAAVESAFVSLLQAQAPANLKRSDDGSLIREEIEAKFVEGDTAEAVRAIVRSLLAEAVERHAGARG
jgi:Calcineurin-like phosphoesterase